VQDERVTHAEAGSEPTTSGTGDLAALLRARLGECTPAEQKAARVLLAGYPASGFETVAVLAGRAGVSAPTVLRLLNRLGFRGLPDFQQALRAELDERQASPLSMYGTADRQGGSAATVFPAAVHRTLADLPPADLDRVVELLADRRLRPVLAGGRFSRLLAEYLHLHLVQMRDGPLLLPTDPVTRAAALAGRMNRDVLVVFDFRRYEDRTQALAVAVRDRGGTVVLVTDRWLSPVAEIADVVLVCQVDSPSPYDSLVGAMAVVEAVVAGLLTRLGEDARERMAACEQAAVDGDLL
jgi:DNA-binding MurR/RpiR family transcriptional regulator